MRDAEREAVVLRPSRRTDLAFITALERREDHRGLIGQWTDDKHLVYMTVGIRDHFVIERDGRREGYLIGDDRREDGAGFYLRRVLVDRKERGTGSQAIARYLDLVLVERAAPFAWLVVMRHNARALAVYRRLGFEPFEAPPRFAAAFDATQAPMEGSLRMAISRETWHHTHHRESAACPTSP
jgi:ribosomal protein S18 acetylase RimI-like enzyme